MVYEQRKVWPSRKGHLFLESGEDAVSICGGVWWVAGDPIQKLDWSQEEHRRCHPYDDLNCCQSCRRVAMKAHGQQYQPLTQKYEHLRKAWEEKQRK